MKKIIQFLIIIILLIILGLIIIFVFNPVNLRSKLIGGVVNSYLSNNLENYVPLEPRNIVEGNQDVGINDKNPLLSADQEKTLESFGVDVSKLPTEITLAMQACFVEKLGETHAMEIVNGAAPSITDFFKAKDCLNK